MTKFGMCSEISASGTMILGGVALAMCATVLAKSAITVKRKGKKAPCPKGMPLVGNLFQVFGDKPFLTFSKWAREYGDVFQLQLGTHAAVVINSIDAAKEALVTQGKALSGRPQFYTMSTLHDKERKFVFAPHSDDLLKLYRKTILSDTRKRMPDLEPLMESEIDKMAEHLFEDNQKEVIVDMRHVIHKLAVNIAHGYAMGSTFELSDNRSEQWSGVLDEYRELLHWFRVENFLPHSHLFMKGYKEKVASFHGKSNKIFLEGIAKAQARRSKMAAEGEGQQEVGLIDTILDMFDNCKEPMNDVNADAIAILRDVMFGCADGSYQPLTWAILFICDHPQVLKKIQNEIDDVLGSRKMPMLSDRDSLPYVEATIREVMRLSEITTLGIPRKTMDDVTVGGYHIPKDTIAIFNVYAIHRDANHWQDPSEFNPERFMDGDDLRPMSELSYLPFSTGNRSCPGQNLARGFLFLLFTRFFQKFDISMATEGVKVEGINAGGAFNPEVKPFKVHLVNRAV